MTSPRVSILLLACLLVTGTPACHEVHHDGPPSGSRGNAAPLVPTFTDATADSGVAFTSLPRGDFAGYGQGAAVADIDGDGDLDIYLPQDEGPCALYRNDGGMRFTEIAAAAGVRVSAAEAHAKCAAFFDMDGDGLPELFVGTTGEGNRLFRNLGDGTFLDVSAASGIGGGTRFTVSAAVGDYDGDGRPDLYECNFAITDYDDSNALQTTPAPNRLWHNEGDGTFVDRAPALGVDDAVATWAAEFVDLDEDGDQDLLVANDLFFFPGEDTRDRAYVNGGAGAGFRFTDEAAAWGLAEAHFGMGFCVGDLDGDGAQDIYVSDRGANELRLGYDTIPMPDHAAAFGVEQAYDPHGQPLVSWGSAMEDFDGDGRTDLLVMNGLLPAQAPGPLATNRQVPALYLARTAPGGSPLPDNLVFEDHAADAGLVALDATGARAGIPCDLDGDGDLDLVISTRHGPARIVRNDTLRRGPWYGVRLRGTRSNRDGLGARLALRRGARTVRSRVTAGGQPGASLPSERILVPGPDSSGAASLIVDWPSGVQQLVHPVKDGWTVVEEPGP